MKNKISKKERVKGMEETIKILSNTKLLKSIKEGIADIKAGRHIKINI